MVGWETYNDVVLGNIATVWSYVQHNVEQALVLLGLNKIYIIQNVIVVLVFLSCVVLISDAHHRFLKSTTLLMISALLFLFSLRW